MMCLERHVLIQKMFTNGVNIDLPIQASIEKTIQWKHTDILVRENFSSAVVSKEGHEKIYHY